MTTVILGQNADELQLPYTVGCPIRPRAYRGIMARGAGAFRIVGSEGSDETERRQVERFIENAYRKQFGSLIDEHYPTIMSSIEIVRGSVQAALGMRPAADHRLFLEHYCERPIEGLVSSVVGRTIDRSAIIEIGNLASRGPTSTVRLVLAAAGYLRRGVCQYAVVTATKQMRDMLDALGFDWRLITPARAERLPDGGRAWGRYFLHDPQVILGAIASNEHPLPIRSHPMGVPE